MPGIKPFEDDATTFTMGELTVENGQERIAIYGSLELTRDQHGLTLARELKAIVSQIVDALEASKSLPDAIERPESPDTVRNPFS